ncbi:MAG TPA: YdeI/OmpD-associated family protein [Terriglobales bacterium]|jgi:Bacteriocin-protection, YdeI or OmpD-Associated/Domain of unknown function (DUF1905)
MPTYTKAPDGTVTFRTKLVKHDNSEACSVNLPFDPKEVLGKIRLPIKAMIHGHTFRTTTFRMGGVDFFVVNEEARQGAKVKGGDTVKVTIQPDTEERTVDIPEELSSLLRAHPAEKAYFDSLSFTHRKEYARWIVGAKQESTRQRRLEKCLEMLKDKQKPRF